MRTCLQELDMYRSLQQPPLCTSQKALMMSGDGKCSRHLAESLTLPSTALWYETNVFKRPSGQLTICSNTNASEKTTASQSLCGNVRSDKFTGCKSRVCVDIEIHIIELILLWQRHPPHGPVTVEPAIPNSQRLANSSESNSPNTVWPPRSQSLDRDVGCTDVDGNGSHMQCPNSAACTRKV